jgi:hypothetical protein
MRPRTLLFFDRTEKVYKFFLFVPHLWSINKISQLARLQDFNAKFRGVNDTLLLIYPIRTVFDKMGMSKSFFSVNLFDISKGKKIISLSKWIRVWVKIIS